MSDFEQFRPYVNGALTRQAYLTGDASKGMLDFGHAAVFADRIEPVETIFDRLIDDAAAALDQLERRTVRPVPSQQPAMEIVS